MKTSKIYLILFFLFSLNPLFSYNPLDINEEYFPDNIKDFKVIRSIIGANNDPGSIDFFSGLLIKRTIFMFMVVESWSAEYIISQLKALDETEGDINLVINSPGGECITGLSIVDFMNTMTNKVNTVTFGECSSMGAVIQSAGTGNTEAAPTAKSDCWFSRTYATGGRTGDEQGALDGNHAGRRHE